MSDAISMKDEVDHQDIMSAWEDRQRDFLERVSRGSHLRLADRQEDKVRQGARRRGLVEFTGKPKRWQLTAAGWAAIACDTT